MKYTQILWYEAAETTVAFFPGFRRRILVNHRSSLERKRFVSYLCGYLYCYIHNRKIYHVDGPKDVLVGALIERDSA
jgi:hypothetical protein